MPTEPRRILQVYMDMRLSQTVSFMDWRDGQMRVGAVAVAAGRVHS